jgi:hypothetical protein
MQSLMEIVGSDERMACVGFALTPLQGGCELDRTDVKEQQNKYKAASACDHEPMCPWRGALMLGPAIRSSIEHGLLALGGAHVRS